jgi:hypothetical protein
MTGPKVLPKDEVLSTAALANTGAVLHQNALGGAPAPQATTQPNPPTPANVTWATLPQLKLDERDGGQLPHPVRDLLLARLGAARLGAPAVWARRKKSGTFGFVPLDAMEKYFTAAKSYTWTPLTPSQASTLSTILPNIKQSTGSEPSDAGALFKKVILKLRPSDEEYSSVTLATFRDTFEKAWRDICLTVEKEVLDLIGRPQFHIYSNSDKSFGPVAQYVREQRTVQMRIAGVTEARIRHEFAHHLEDCGPMEVWFGLASMLRRFGGDRTLQAPVADTTRYPTFQFDETKLPKLPDYGYMATYYNDGGTECLAIPFEDNLIRDGIQQYSHYEPDWLYLLLAACRPSELAQHGLDPPALVTG